MTTFAFRRVLLVACLGLAASAQPAVAALKASFSGTITSYNYSSNGNANGLTAPMGFVASFIYDLSKGLSEIEPNLTYYHDFTGGPLADRLIFSSNIVFNGRLLPFNTVETVIYSSIHNNSTETSFAVADNRRQGPVYVVENYLTPILFATGPLIDFSQPGQFTGTGSGGFDRRTDISVNDVVVKTVIEQGTFSGPMTLTITDYVPEPAAWAMLIAGFGLTGTVLRGHRAAAISA